MSRPENMYNPNAISEQLRSEAKRRRDAVDAADAVTARLLAEGDCGAWRRDAYGGRMMVSNTREVLSRSPDARD